LCEDIGLAARKVRLVRNGVDADRFRPRQERERLRRERGYAPEDQLVAAVGRLDPVKNYPLLVASFGTVVRQHPRARLLFVGAGPDRDAIEREIERRQLGRVVHLAGHREDVEDWLAAADVFVHPSLSEGMNNAALEAMAAGVPVVATRVGGLPEVVVDGVTGRLCAPGDEAGLAAAIAFYCEDTRTRAEHGRAGRARVVAEFTPQAMIAAYVELYEGMLAGGRLGAETATQRI
jgi:glycosyltransferase involved in cell wall biosynthesis